MDYRYQQYIGGEWRGASNGGTWDVVNPATEEVVRTVPYGVGADCRAAIGAASGAFRAWADATAYARAGVLKQAAEVIRSRAEELARTMVLESGKPLAQARGEWLVAADLFEWFGEEGKRAYGRVVPSRSAARRHFVLKQPIGAVGVITAWNFPAYNVARAAAAALAAGCTVVVRPSEYTPLTAMAMANIVADAGAPAGVFNVINGEPEPMGQELLGNPACAKIHFTGSARVGKLLMDGASKTVTRLSLELGGNAPVIICPDVDVERVVAGAVAAKFRNSGQVCVSPQRFFVRRDIADEFVERIASQIAKLRVGSGLDADTDVGPLINAKQRDRVETLVAAARAAGARVPVGGTRSAQHARGYFYEPTVIGDVTTSMSIYGEEIFGPVMPVVSFDDVDEAIANANATRYGLAAYVWTNNLRVATRAYERLEFGLIGVNDWTPFATEVPFPGWKESGLGRESGLEGLDEYLETKVVTIGGN